MKYKLPPEITRRYEPIELLGKGGMGKVYLARDKTLPRKVAIKVVKEEFQDNPEVLARIHRESQLHGKLGTHKNIVTLFDLITIGNEIYLVLEYVDGDNLAEILLRNHQQDLQLTEHKTLQIIKQLLQALIRIHSMDVVHRDIKPENIMLAYDDEGELVAKLMDFGIAKGDEKDEANTHKLTQFGAGGPGTPAYMAPEQIDSATHGEIDIRTDLYSVGIIFYELLTGAPPYEGSLTEIYGGHLMKEISQSKNFNKLSIQWKEIVLKFLSKRPADRFQTARECLDILKDSESAPPARRDHQQYSDSSGKTRIASVNTSTRLAGSSVEQNRTQLIQDDEVLNELLHRNTHGTTQSARKEKKHRLKKASIGLLFVLLVAAGSFYFVKEQGNQPPENRTNMAKENQVSSPDQTANQVSSPDQTANQVSSPDQTANQVSSPDQTPNQVSSPDQTANQVSSPDQTPNQVSSPDQTTNQVSSPDQTTNQASSPDKTTNQANAPAQTLDQPDTAAQQPTGNASALAALKQTKKELAKTQAPITSNPGQTNSASSALKSARTKTNTTTPISKRPTPKIRPSKPATTAKTVPAVTPRKTKPRTVSNKPNNQYNAPKRIPVQKSQSKFNVRTRSEKVSE